MFIVTIDIDKCEACGDCVDFCPNQSFSIVEENGREHAIYNAEEDECIGCLSCQEICPTGAIVVTEVA